MPLDTSFSLSARIVEDIDAPRTLTTPYSIDVGDTFEGTLTRGDTDIIRLDVISGQSYEISLTGDAGGLNDPYVNVLSDVGVIIDSNDNAGPNTLDSFVSYTATDTGPVYLWIDTNGANDVGGYTISVSAGTPAPTAPVATWEELADYLMDDYWALEGLGRHTFGDSTITVDLGGLTADGQQLARWAFEAWEMLADIDFVEVSSGADINFTDHEQGAFSSFAIRGSTTISSTVNISTAWLTQQGTTIDSYSLSTYIHEIGHSLGLGHMGDYDGSANYFEDATFGNDSELLTVMSYFDASDNPLAIGSDTTVITGQMIDILAIQELYGAASGGVTAGNTTYGENSNLGNYLDEVFDALASGNTSRNFDGDDVGFTLFDEGGVDLLDFSTDTEGQQIDLRNGSFSSIYGLVSNLAIAVGTEIENVNTGQGNDFVQANELSNVINTNAGNDTIVSDDTGGSDTINGGSGQDELRLGFDFSDVSDASMAGSTITLTADFGSLTVLNVEAFVFADMTFTLEELESTIADFEGRFVGEQIQGTSGSDTLNGSVNNDEISGRAGNDYIDASSGEDTIGGGEGFDTIHGRDGDDSIAGNNGYDLVYGGNGDDTLVGNNGFDTIYGDAGDDLIYGGISPDDLHGGDGNDAIYGQAGFDALFGGDGDDVMNGNAGADLVNGGSGNDTLEGGLNHDTMLGGDGNDRISASNGRDILDGGAGNDVLRGNAGNDTLNGGEGNDTLNGGLASDTFVFTGGQDIVQDFQNNNDSIIIDIDLLAGLGLAPNSTTIEDLRGIFEVDGDNITGTFGNGNTLEILGVNNFNAFLDDMTIETIDYTY